VQADAVAFAIDDLRDEADVARQLQLGQQHLRTEFGGAVALLSSAPPMPVWS
jgi:hypothetical protein